jgi:hypothetical protein
MNPEIPPPPAPLLRQVAAYPHYSVLMYEVDDQERVPANLDMHELSRLARKYHLFRRAHPEEKLTYSQIVNLNDDGQLGGAKKRKSKKVSKKKSSKKKTSKKSNTQLGGAKKRKSKKSSKKSSKKTSKKMSRK